MSRNKKTTILVGCIIIVSCIGTAAVIFSQKNKVPAVTNSEIAIAETQIATQSHKLTATLNKDAYEVVYNGTFDISEILATIEADDSTTVQFADGTTSKSYSSIGPKTEPVIIKDTYNNTKTVEITINVVDTQAPVISGVSACSISKGSTFSALGGVSANDDIDGDVSGTLACSSYDINAVGTQTLTITAADKSGNISSTDFVLTVNEKPVATNQDSSSSSSSSSNSSSNSSSSNSSSSSSGDTYKIHITTDEERIEMDKNRPTIAPSYTWDEVVVLGTSMLKEKGLNCVGSVASEGSIFLMASDGFSYKLKSELKNQTSLTWIQSTSYVDYYIKKYGEFKTQ